MHIVVQKFGGTSVRDAKGRLRAAERVQTARQEGAASVVVVSAMGRRGDPYATDTLLSLLNIESPGDDADLLLSCGEIISAVLFAGVLRSIGIPAKVLTGGQAGIITDGHHQNAAIQRVEAGRLEHLLELGVVPVVAGFQGVTPEGETTTLGRGGSDTSAAALGAALHAALVEIYTDVAGILTADPRIVPDAMIIPEIDYDESFQLAHMGAKVIHPRAVEICRQHGVPIRVLSAFCEGPGTLIAFSRATMDRWQHRDPAHTIVGVTSLSDVVQVRLTTEGRSAAPVFRRLADLGVSVDLINVFPELQSFIVPETQHTIAGAALEDLGYPFELRCDVAKVSVVGSAIHGLPGVMALIVEALEASSVPILASSDSHSTISCLVPRTFMEAAVRALHHQFHLQTAREAML